LVPENQCEQVSRGDQLVAGRIFGFDIKVNNQWDGLVSAMRSIGPLSASLFRAIQCK
jgi:hypothetical protein